MAMTLRQMSTPYAHWEYVHPQSGDRLRVVPERGGIVTEWLCNGREILYFDQTRYADPKQSIRGGVPVLFPICGNLPCDRLPLKSGEATLNSMVLRVACPGSWSYSTTRAACVCL
jgi:galactose mutarotase-like enzyme